MKKLILFCLLGLFTLSCQKNDDVNPTDTCKLGQFGDGDQTNDLTYDAAGNLTQWVVTSNLQGGSKFVITYAFTRDATGRISSRLQTVAIDGKVQGKPSTTQYTYTNGLLTSANTVFELTASTRVVTRTYTYDSNQRLIKSVSTETGFTQTNTYEYDSRGNCTKYNRTNSFGYKEERVFTYDDSKNPEQLLIKSIPFNLFTGLPWSVNVAVTTKATFDYGNGKGPIIDNSTRSNIKTGVNGYVTSASETFDSDGYVAQETYTLTGCN